jgi:hypothetical protein
MKTKTTRILASIIAGALILIIISTILFLALNKQKNDSTSFTINMYGDFTSSGGSRNYNATLIFQDSKLISGNETYETWPGNGGHNIINCILDVNSLTWKDTETNGEMKCDSIPEYVPLNITDLMQKINSKEFKSLSECGHAVICYEIIK